MQHKFKIVCIVLIALTGSFSVSASPTFIENCFETEAEAKRQQNAYAHRDVDNTETSSLDDRVKKRIGSDWDNVELATLKAILGEPEGRALYASKTSTHSWSLPLSYTPSAGKIVYNSSRGYCVNTRRAPYGAIEFEWTEHFQDSQYGMVKRHYINN